MKIFINFKPDEEELVDSIVEALANTMPEFHKGPSRNKPDKNGDDTHETILIHNHRYPQI